MHTTRARKLKELGSTALCYILDEKHNPVICSNIQEWCSWMGPSNKRIAKDDLGDCKVSTVFLGVDHNYIDKGPPILFETLVFERRDTRYDDQEMKRYATWAQAVRGHKQLTRKWEKIVTKRVENDLKKDPTIITKFLVSDNRMERLIAKRHARWYADGFTNTIWKSS